MTKPPDTPLVALLKERIARQSSQRTRRQIAQAIGFESEDILKKIETGSVKLPVDYALRFADELGANRREFSLLVLRQFFPSDLVDALEADEEREALKDLARASLIALQVEVALIGSTANALERSSMQALETANKMSIRQRATSDGLQQLLRDLE